MTTILSDVQLQAIRSILSQGAKGASQALSIWIGAEVRLSVGVLEQVELDAAAQALGPPETLIAACAMRLTGPLTGALLLCFDDRAGLALVDLLLRQPVGTTTEWGEIERSAAMETMNIVGCAYLNALANEIPLQPGEVGVLTPTPPTFLHEFAGSLLQFTLMEQAAELDRVLLARTGFEASPAEIEGGWTLLFVPDAPSLKRMATSLSDEESH